MAGKIIAVLAVLALLAGSAAGPGVAETGVYIDEEGGEWNYDTGIYTAPDGRQERITGDGDGGGSGGSGAITVTDTSGVAYNPDGSMTVESGALPIAEEDGGGSAGLTQEEWEARMKKAERRNGTYTETFYFGPEKEPVPAEVIYVGLARSRIRIGQDEMMVNTCDLAWSTEAPENQVLAVVNANRVGYANLRDNTSTRSFIMNHCITGRVVRVLATGKNWTMVDYDGMRGYVLTDSLIFHANSIRSYETGLISINGRTTGKSPINIRAKAKSGARILGEYVLGTPLTIFYRDDKWCEVDVAGWHGYILTEYVTLEDPFSMSAALY